MLKIWEKWDPDAKKDQTDLESFIKDNHPAAIEIRRIIYELTQSTLYGIENFDKERRKRLIEKCVQSAWQYDHTSEEYNRKLCDEKILYCLYGIHLSFSELLHYGGDDESSHIKNWEGKSFFLIDDDELEERWDNLWECYGEEEFYGSTELKDWLWKEEYFGLKEKLYPQLMQLQKIIPNEMKEEIEEKIKEINDVMFPLKEQLEEKGLIKTSVKHRYFVEDFWKDLDHKGIVKKFEEEQKAMAYKKDIGYAILELSEYWTTNIVYKDSTAFQIEGYTTLEKMKKGNFLGGEEYCIYGNDNSWNDEADGEIVFTPDWGEFKGITDIENYLGLLCEERKIKEAYFWCRGCHDTGWYVGTIKKPDEPKGIKNNYDSIEHLLEVRPKPETQQRLDHRDTHRYFHYKDGKGKELFDKELPIKGLLNGSEDDLAHAYAVSAGKKEWKDSDGKIWNQDSWHRERTPWEFEEE